MKRIIALLVCFSLLVGSLPLSSLATDLPSSTEISEFPTDTPIAPMGELSEQSDSDEESDEGFENLDSHDENSESIENADSEDESSEINENTDSGNQASENIEEVPHDDSDENEFSPAASIMEGTASLSEIILFLERDSQHIEDAAVFHAITDKVDEILEEAKSIVAAWWADREEKNAAVLGALPLSELDTILTQLDALGISTASQAETLTALETVQSKLTLANLSIKTYLTDTAAAQSYDTLHKAVCALAGQALPHLSDSYQYTFRYDEEQLCWYVQSKEDSTLFLAPRFKIPNIRETTPVQITLEEPGFLLSDMDGSFLFYEPERGFITDPDFGTMLYALNRDSGTASALDGFYHQNTVNGLTCFLCVEGCEVNPQTGAMVSVLYLICPDQTEPLLKLKELGVPDMPVPLPDTDADIDILDSVDGKLPTDYCDNWEVQLYPDSTETRILYKAFVAGAQGGRTQPDNPHQLSFDICDDSNNVFAEAVLEVPTFAILGSAEPIPISSCVFQMVPAGDGKYYVYSGGKFLYLDGDASNYTNVMIEKSSTTVPSAVTISVDDNGIANFSSENNYLYYMPGQGKLSNEAGKNAHSGEFAFLNDFVLFRKAGDVYYRATSIVDNGLYVIAADIACEAADCAIVVPSLDGESSTLAGSSLNIIGVDNGYSTEIVFTGKTLPDVENHSALFLNCFEVNNTKPGSATALLSTLEPLEQASGSDETVHLGIIVEIDATTSASPVSVLNTQYNYTKDNLELTYPDSSNQPINENNITISSSTSIDTYVGVGNAGSYNQTNIPLSECLYQFEDAGDGSYYIKAVKDGLGYLNADSHALVGRNPAAFKVEPIPKTGLFTLCSNGEYVHFWRWKLFSTTASSYIQKDPGGTKELLIFRKTAEDGHPLLKGYELATEINTNDQYVIGAVYEQQLYFIHPTLDTGNNDHTAKRTTIWSQGSCEITIQPNPGKTGKATAVFQNGQHKTTYELDFQNKPETEVTNHFVVGTGAGTGSPMKSLVISSGLQFQIHVDAELEGKTLEWFTSNPSLGRIDQNGLLTLQNPHSLANQARENFKVYLKVTEEDESSFYTLPVTIAKNEYTSTRVFNQYIGALENTTVYMSYPQMGVNTYTIGQNFIPMDEYQVTYLLRDVNQNWGAHYFAVPDSGYALAYMSASRSAGQYFKLDDANAENTEYYNNGPCVTQKGLYDDDHTGIIKNMLQYAIDLGCVGAMGFTGRMNQTAAQASVLEFRSEKLPTVNKEVAYVFPAGKETERENFINAVRNLESFKPIDNPDTYSEYLYSKKEGTEVEVGSVVIFKITVDKPENPEVSGAPRIDYKAVTLTESIVDLNLQNVSLDNPTFIVPSRMRDTYHLTDGVSSLNLLELVESDPGEKQYVFYVQFTIPEIRSNDKTYTIGKNIELTNNVNLTTAFRTPYQTLSNLHLYSSARASLTLAITNCLEYVNLSLDEGIHANVFLNRDSFHKWYGNWYDDNHFIIFELGENGVVTAKKRINSGVESSFTPLEVGSSETTYYRFSLPISAFDLFTPITVYIVDSKGARVSNQFSFTVNDYINKIISSTNLITSWQIGETRYSYGDAQEMKTKLDTLLKALQTFSGYSLLWKKGEETQSQNYNIIDDAEMFLGMDEPAFRTDYKANAIEFTAVEQVLSESSTTIGLTVHFKSKRPFNPQEAKCVVQKIEGEIIYSYYYPIHKENDGSYSITINNIGGKLLGSIFTISLQWSSSPEKDSITLTSSTYPILLAHKHTQGQAYSHLEYMEYALYKYIQAAKAFFGQPNYGVSA